MRSLTLMATALLTVCSLEGCGGKEVIGSETMPKEFGDIASHWLSCTNVSGLYAWPPIQGNAYVPYKSSKPQYYLSVPVYDSGYADAQLWLQGRDKTSSHIVVRSRMVIKEPRYRNGLSKQWAYMEYTHDCKGGWAVLPDLPFGTPDEHYGFAAQQLKMGGKIARLQDGGLAVGQKLTVAGRGTHTIGWGDTPFFSFNLPDRELWYWSKLQRVADTGANISFAQEEARLNEMLSPAPMLAPLLPPPVSTPLSPVAQMTERIRSRMPNNVQLSEITPDGPAFNARFSSPDQAVATQLVRNLDGILPMGSVTVLSTYHDEAGNNEVSIIQFLPRQAR